MTSISSAGQIGSYNAARAISAARQPVSPEQLTAAAGEQIKAGVKQEAAIQSLKTSQDTAKATVEALLGSLVDVSA